MDDGFVAREPEIDRAVFARRFADAVETAVAFAASMVRPTLPASRRFLIQPNASFDGNPLVDDERVYPGDSLPHGELLGPLTAAQAVDWMWRAGKVPEWVDVAVYGTDADHTYVRLICCGRFTGFQHRLYYRDALPPFGTKSPDLPQAWVSPEASGRFDLPAIGPGVRFRPPTT